MSFVLHGDIPEDLVVNIRERRKPFKNEQPHWKFKNKANFTIQAFDQIVFEDPTASLSKFGHVYVEFNSEKEYCKFQVQLTFPDQDKKDQRERKKLLKQQNNGRPMTQDEIYEQAQANFNAIASKYLPQPSTKDFLQKNIVNLNQPILQGQNVRFEKNKYRQIEAKMRRDQKTKSE